MTLTCVSAFFLVENKHDTQYFEWFMTSLRIQCQYVFFTTSEYVYMIKECRNGLETHFIITTLADFYTNCVKDRMITHPTHSPSIDLNLIWNEKLYMIKRAAEINPFNSDWFMWVDAGLCIYRTSPPPTTRFPSSNILETLTPTYFYYSSSTTLYNSSLVTRTNYYHYISGTFLLHKTLIPSFTDLYTQYLFSHVDKNNIWTDQVLLTHIFKEYPDKFYKLANGYGEIVRILYDI